MFFLICSDLQADSLYWFLSVNDWGPLSVRPPGPDSSSHQREWSVCQETLNRHWKSTFSLLRYWEIACLVHITLILLATISSSSDGVFASGSHAGELILWDAIDWNVLAYEHILWEESQACTQAEIRLTAPKPSEMSIQHLTTNGKVRKNGCTCCVSGKIVTMLFCYCNP